MIGVSPPGGMRRNAWGKDTGQRRNGREVEGQVDIAIHTQM